MGSLKLVYESEIRKPDTDKRNYRRVELENGLLVLLISDPDMRDQEGTAAAPMEEEEEEESCSGESDDDDDDDDDDEEDDEEEEGEESSTKRAAVAMCVCTGSFSDPEPIAGVSHFLEHMLFMGSKDFPSENEYDSFLSKNGGSSNAYTDLECTNYYFDVQPKGLHGALQRFAAFFVSPLCSRDAVDREVQAVESEFVQALQNNSARLSQLRCHTALPGHVFSKFFWGNKASLIDIPTKNGLEPREELMKYYHSEYSAERMSLVVLGAEDLGTLETWSRDLFSRVPSGLGSPVSFSDQSQPFQGGWLYKLRMTKDGHQLHVLFQLPCLHKVYGKKPDDYVSHLIGHEGKHSLLSVLKSKGLVTHISAGVGADGECRSTVGYMFNITFMLTEAGLNFGKDGFGVVEYLFAYINLIREKGPQKWIWEEMAAASKVKFKFAEEDAPEDYVQELAVNLRIFKAQDILEGDYLHEEWDPKLVSEILGYFTPSNMRVEVQSSNFKDEDFSLNEPWFNFPYSAEKLDQEALERLGTFSGVAGLGLPDRNEFLPSDFSIKAQDFIQGEREQYEEAGTFGAPTPEALLAPPSLIWRKGNLEAWYKFDRFFKAPRMVALLSFYSPHTHSSAEQCVLLKLCSKVLEDTLVEMTYLADVAGLATSIYSCQDRLEIKVEGFSDKLPSLLGRVLDGMANFSPLAERFEASKEFLRRALQNSVMKPSRHATYLRLLSLQLESWPLEFQLEALEKVDIDKLKAFLSRLLAEGQKQMLVHGNITLGEACSVVKSTTKYWDTTTAFGNAARVKKIAQLKAGQNFVHSALVQNPSEKNNASEIYVQLGAENHKDCAALSILDQIMYEPFFDTLRTKEQLGYSVCCGLRNTFGVLGFYFAIVSSKFTPLHIEERVEKFVKDFADDIAKMTAEEWQQHIKSAVEAKQQQDQTLDQESERHWEQISMSRYDFFQRNHQALEIKKWDKDSFLGWFKKHICTDSEDCKRLSVRIFSREHRTYVAGDSSYNDGDLSNFREEVDTHAKSFALPPTCALVEETCKP